jgi:hypothetical protein
MFGALTCMQPERVKMMQAWADYLDELRDAGKVIPLRRENA